MIKQAGGAPRITFIVGARGNLAGKTDSTIDQPTQPVAKCRRYGRTLVYSRMQVGGERGIRAVAADRAGQRIDRDDVAGTFPDRSKMRIPQQSGGGEFLDIADAAAHLHRIAAGLASISRGA